MLRMLLRGTVLVFLLMAPMVVSAVPIVYDITLSGIDADTGAAVMGTGVATFDESAFDTDGTFNFDGNLLGFSLDLEGVLFGLADIEPDPWVEYEVSLGELVGFDWCLFPVSDVDVDECDFNIGIAASLNSRIFVRNFNPSFDFCEFSCSLDQTWTRRTGMVPEPGTLALLGLGIVGIGATRRRKRR